LVYSHDAKIMFQILNNIFSLQIDRRLALKRLMKPRQQVASLQLILSMNKYVLEEYETANDNIKDDELLMLADGGSEWYLYLNG